LTARRRRLAVALGALAVALALVAILAPGGPVRGPARGLAGVSYYVAAAGSDGAGGTTPATAWRTVARVNRQALSPGDTVRFAGGQRFSDAILSPSATGSPGAPIVFTSYGHGVATLVRGVFFVQSDLRFQRLALTGTFYGGSEVHGRSDHITLDRVSISLPPGNQSLGLYANGDGWVIENSEIRGSGLSGMLLSGDGYTITGNTITHTGLDTSNGYNNHGIYLDAADATITGNTILRSAESAISVRYHGSTITGNTISGGRIGIDFFQTDSLDALSTWSGNSISGTTSAGIYISSRGSAGPTRESFTITGNSISARAGVNLNLAATAGRYRVSGNRCDPPDGSCGAPGGSG
jgi:parallel beta-helix repeat protein